jgi:hypothetical protein
LCVLHSLPPSFKPTSFYLCSKATRLTLEALPSSYAIVTWGCSLAIKWLGDEADLHLVFILRIHSTTLNAIMVQCSQNRCIFILTCVTCYHNLGISNINQTYIIYCWNKSALHLYYIM